MEHKEFVLSTTNIELINIALLIQQINTENKNELIKIVKNMESWTISFQQFKTIEDIIEAELLLHKAQIARLSTFTKNRRSPFLSQEELLKINSFLQQKIYPKIIKDMVEQSLEIEKKFENDFVILFSRWRIKNFYIYNKITKDIQVFNSVSYIEKFSIILATTINDNHWDVIFNNKWEKLLSKDKKYKVLSNSIWATEKGFLKVIEVGIWNILLKFPEQIQVTPEWEWYDSFEFWFYDELWILWFKEKEKGIFVVVLFDKNGKKIWKEVNKNTFFDEYYAQLISIYQLQNTDLFNPKNSIDNFNSTLSISFQHPELKEKVLTYMKEQFWVDTF